MTEPLLPAPRLVYGITAVSLILVTLAIQLSVTVRNLVLTDLRWEWEFYLITAYLAKFTLPALLLGGYLAWRGVRLADKEPGKYAGRRLSRVGLITASVLMVVNGAVLLARVPTMLENRRLKQQSYTQAMLYKLSSAIAEYREHYGAYPERLIDLQEMDPSLRPVLDYWDHPLIYRPMSPEVASRVTPVPFQNYVLVSRGPDGVLGTGDDIVMRDGLIISVDFKDLKKEIGAELLTR